MLGLSWFWVMGATLLAELPTCWCATTWAPAARVHAAARRLLGRRGRGLGRLPAAAARRGVRPAGAVRGGGAVRLPVGFRPCWRGTACGWPACRRCCTAWPAGACWPTCPAGGVRRHLFRAALRRDPGAFGARADLADDRGEQRGQRRRHGVRRRGSRPCWRWPAWRPPPSCWSPLWSISRSPCGSCASCRRARCARMFRWYFRRSTASTHQRAREHAGFRHALR